MSEYKRIFQSENEIPQNEEISLSEVEKYVEANTVPAREGRKCVDGRYPSDVDSGRIARPGGDMGYVMAVLKVNNDYGVGMTASECFEMVYSVTEDDHFRAHTDEHTEEVQANRHDSMTPIIGCGHVAKASLEEYAEKYGVSSAQIHDVVDALSSKDEAVVACLPGEHAECGVLVVNSPDKTVLPTDGVTQFFVYDQMRDEEYMRKLCEKIDHPEVTYERMRDASNAQLGATLDLLAHGLPIFAVDINEKTQVAAVGHVGEK